MNDEAMMDEPEANDIESALKQAILEGFIEVPMLPEVANRVLALTQDPESSAAQLAELIQSDQSLAGHVMRIANSAAYTPLSNLVSLQQAVARLGMNVICEISMAAVMSAKLFNTPGYEDYVEHNWEHALATSLWAKEIARQCRTNVEVSFFAGLLHSIGKPAVLQTVLDIAKDRGEDISEDEVHRLESQYSQQVTELVVSRWEMPVQVIEAVKPYDSLDSSYDTSKIAAAVNVGAHFATYMLNISAEENKETLMTLPALGVLNLYQDEVEKTLLLEPDVQRHLDGLSA